MNYGLEITGVSSSKTGANQYGEFYFLLCSATELKQKHCNYYSDNTMGITLNDILYGYNLSLHTNYQYFFQHHTAEFLSANLHNF